VEVSPGEGGLTLGRIDDSSQYGFGLGKIGGTDVAHRIPKVGIDLFEAVVRFKLAKEGADVKIKAASRIALATLSAQAIHSI
jgi:hypothetical protein